MSKNEIICLENKLAFDQSSNNQLIELSKKSLEQRFDENIQKLINNFNKIPSFIEIKNSLQTESLYRVIIPSNINEKLVNGLAEWNFDKSGMQLPTIKDNKGSFIYQARLEEITLDRFDNLNNIIIQSTLSKILNQLEIINKQVSEVLRGQTTDRIGTVIGAEETYKQAMLTVDFENRKHLLYQAIAELNKGRSQLILSLEDKFDFIDKIPESDFKIFLYSILHKIDTKKINKQFIEIQEIFTKIISSSYYLALSYEELNETLALKESLIPLEQCIFKFAENYQVISNFIPFDEKIHNLNKLFQNPADIINLIASNRKKLTLDNSQSIELELSGKQLLCIEEKTK